MAYITKQWLDNNPKRNLDHQLEEVALHAQPVSASRQPHVTATLTAVSGNKDNYQELYFEQSDVDSIVMKLMRLATGGIQSEAAVEVLLSMPEPQFSAALANLFTKRASQPCN